jgi:regulator of sigma E protease
MSITLLILGLILFISLVVVHEFGHFIVARRNGVDVEEFGIGFPPRAWGKKTKAGFIFSLNWLPIGGFVKLKGESDAATEKGTLGAASTSAKARIMLAGVGMNLLVAFGLLTVLAWIGMPQLVDNQFSIKSDTTILKSEVLAGYVEPGSPAAKGGIQARDRLLTVSYGGRTQKLTEASQLPKLTDAYQGKKISIGYDHDGQFKSADIQLRDKAAIEAGKRAGKQEGYLGISPAEYKLTRAAWSAPVVAAGLIGQFTALTFQGLGTAIAAVFQGEGSKAAAQVSGPVGIVVILKDGSLLGIQFILMIIAIISLTLAIMNVLPIPALDGGRLYMILLSRLFGKRLTQEMEERIVGSSFMFLLFLIVLITIIDVKRFF